MGGWMGGSYSLYKVVEVGGICRVIPLLGYLADKLSLLSSAHLLSKWHGTGLNVIRK